MIATHVRNYDKGELVEEPEHVAEMVPFAPPTTTLDRLHHACANTAASFAALAARQGNLGATRTG